RALPFAVRGLDELAGDQLATVVGLRRRLVGLHAEQGRLALGPLAAGGLLLVGAPLVAALADVAGLAAGRAVALAVAVAGLRGVGNAVGGCAVAAAVGHLLGVAGVLLELLELISQAVARLV